MYTSSSSVTCNKRTHKNGLYLEITVCQGHKYILFLTKPIVKTHYIFSDSWQSRNSLAMYGMGSIQVKSKMSMPQ